MATDSTELTFVRCPSCRSLVPAVSTRCRMCGATLDATAADEGFLAIRFIEQGHHVPGALLDLGTGDLAGFLQ